LNLQVAQPVYPWELQKRGVRSEERGENEKEYTGEEKA